MRKTTRRPGRAGSSPRRSSPSAGAAACAVSICAARPPATRPPPPRHPIPIPKTTQRRSQAGSSPIPSSPTAGAAAWGAFPRAAPDRRRPLASRPARPETPQARRHQQSSQLLLLPAAPLRFVLRPQRQLKGVVGGSAPRKRRRAPSASNGSRQRSARRKTDTYAAVLSFYASVEPPLPGEQAAAAECQRYTRSGASAGIRVAKHSQARTTVAQ